MLAEELRDKLTETLAICDLHHQRMMFAYNSISGYFPLTETGFSQISPIELAVSMKTNNEPTAIIPDYIDVKVSVKVVKIIQSYTKIVNKVVWGK